MSESMPCSPFMTAMRSVSPCRIELPSARICSARISRRDGAYERTDTRFAASVAAFGMVLRNSEHKGAAIQRSALETTSGDRGGYRGEFDRMIGRILNSERRQELRAPGIRGARNEQRRGGTRSLLVTPFIPGAVHSWRGLLLARFTSGAVHSWSRSSLARCILGALRS